MVGVRFSRKLRLVHSGLCKLQLTTWDSVVDRAEVKDPLHLLEVSGASIRHLLESLENTAAKFGPKEMAMVTPNCVERGLAASFFRFVSKGGTGI